MYNWIREKFAGETIFDSKVKKSEESIGVSVRKHGKDYTVVIHSPGKVAGEHFVTMHPNSVKGVIEELKNANDAVVNDMMPKFGKRI